MQVGFHEARNDAVARAEDVLADDAFQGQLLAALLALDEETEFLRQRAQRLDHVTRRIAPRTARTARHAFAAIPDRVALQKLLDGFVVARLHDGDDLAGIVVVELGRRADARADPAVHARLKALLHPHVLHKHIEVLGSHIFISFFRRFFPLSVVPGSRRSTVFASLTPHQTPPKGGACRIASGMRTRRNRET